MDDEAQVVPIRPKVTDLEFIQMWRQSPLVMATAGPVATQPVLDAIDELVAHAKGLTAKLAVAEKALDYCATTPHSGWTIAQAIARQALSQIQQPQEAGITKISGDAW